VKPIIIAALIVVPFVLFIAAALVYQSQTGTDIVTGERKGVADDKWGEEIAKIKSVVDNPPASCDPSYLAVCIEQYTQTSIAKTFVTRISWLKEMILTNLI
jgi:hypothetical protein